MMRKTIQAFFIAAIAMSFIACSHQDSTQEIEHHHPHNIESSANPYKHLSKKAYADAGKECTDNQQCESNVCQINDAEAFITSAENPNLTFKGQCATSDFQKEVSCLDRLVAGKVVLQGCD